MTKTEMVAAALEKGLIKNKTAGMKMKVEELRTVLALDAAFPDQESAVEPEVISTTSANLAMATGLPAETFEQPEFSGVPLLPEGVVVRATLSSEEIYEVPEAVPPTLAERLKELQAKLDGLPKGIPHRTKKERELQKTIRKIGRKLVASVAQA
jgi:hypothetical protein